MPACRPLAVLSLIAAVLGPVAALVGAAPAVGQPGLYGGQPGVYIYVPRVGGYVYVPLDPSGQPIVPGAEPARPAVPPPPPAPRAPGAPAAAPTDTGYLVIESDPVEPGAQAEERRPAAGTGYFVVPVP
jgi:hypothetical protein